MSNKRGPIRLVVLVSDTGLNMQALLHTCAGPSYGARVVVVGADRRDVPTIRAAKEAGVPTFVRILSERSPREEWDESLRDAVAAYKPDIVALAGFLKLVDPEFLAVFSQRVVNARNVLLPSFPEIRGPADALAYGVKITGATLFVVGPGMDTELILGQITCPVLEEDSEEALIERIKEIRRVQSVELIGQIAREGWWVDGRKAGIGTRLR